QLGIVTDAGKFLQPRPGAGPGSGGLGGAGQYATVDPTVQLQYRRRARVTHRGGEPPAVPTEQRAERPPVELQRAVRRARDLHGRAQIASGFAELRGVHPRGPGPFAQVVLDRRGVVGDEVALRLHRNLEAVEVPGRAPLLAVV